MKCRLQYQVVSSQQKTADSCGHRKALFVKRIKFPVCFEGHAEFPRESTLCPCCQRNDISETNSFVAIGGGCYFESISQSNPTPDSKRDAYFDLWWHGAHDGGVGIHPELNARLIVADDVKRGQFSIRFCSPDCLRKFLNFLVDELETAIAEDGEENSTSS